MLSILVHVKTEPDARTLCREIKTAFDGATPLLGLLVGDAWLTGYESVVMKGAVQLSLPGCKACQMVVWQLGDARFGSKPPRYDEAVLLCPSFATSR